MYVYRCLKSSGAVVAESRCIITTPSNELLFAFLLDSQTYRGEEQRFELDWQVSL